MKSGVLLTALWVSACVLLPLRMAAAKAPQPSPAPIQILGAEHDLIGKMSAFAEGKAKEIRKDRAVDPQELERLHDFFTNFADRCHHAKEESSLFPVLMGKRVDPVIIRLLIKQHEEGRLLLDGVKEVLERPDEITGERRAALAEYLLQYSQLMQRHIELESRYLWPKASRILDERTKDQLVGEFERIERELGEGFHKKYHDLAMDLLNHP